MAGLTSFLEQARARRDEASRQFEAFHQAREQAAVSVSDQVRSRPKPLPQRTAPQVTLTVERPSTQVPQVGSSSSADTVHPSYGQPIEVPSPFQWKEPKAGDKHPPLPAVMPALTPIARLKNETAMNNSYTRGGAGILYDTPVKVRIGDAANDIPRGDTRRPDRLYGSMGIGGWYNSHDDLPVVFEDNSLQRGNLGQPEIYITGSNSARTPAERRGENEATLAHEFAHKWYDKQLPDRRRTAWTEGGWNLADSYAKDMAEGRTHDPNYPIDFYNETYAHNAERGPHFMAKSVRDDYYPGLYKDNVWPATPVSDTYALRADEPVDDWQQALGRQHEAMSKWKDALAGATPFNPTPGWETMDWVPEKDAPNGYYEDYGKKGPSPWDRGWGNSMLGPNKAYSTDYWVPEYEEAYDAQGKPKVSIPMPLSWDPPQWPSIEMYDRANHYGMAGG